MVWFALTLQGYDARLYSYENYLYNQAALGKADAINCYGLNRTEAKAMKISRIAMCILLLMAIFAGAVSRR